MYFVMCGLMITVFETQVTTPWICMMRGLLRTKDVRGHVSWGRFIHTVARTLTGYYLLENLVNMSYYTDAVIPRKCDESAFMCTA